MPLRGGIWREGPTYPTFPVTISYHFLGISYISYLSYLILPDLIAER